MELEALPPIQQLHTLKYGLLFKRRFWPIFVATFLGSFNDNLLRSGLVVLIAYSAGKGLLLPARPDILVTFCSVLLIVPLLFFSSLAGTFADKYEKSLLVRLAKAAEVLIMTCACYSFATQNIMLLMLLLFISGTHSTFYSPVKFSILPDHMERQELVAANGFMASGSYMATLFGLITGGLLVDYSGNVIGITAIAVACTGFVASLFIIPSKPAHPDSVIRFNLWHGTKEIIGYAMRDRSVMYSIFALSWFLLVGSVYMAQFANYAEGVIHANNEVYILFLVVFSIGIVIGSLLCDRLLKGEVSIRLMPFAGLGVSFFSYLMVFTTPAPEHAGLMDVADFLSNSRHLPLLFSMLMVAVSGGIYIVPLYAMVQAGTPAWYRSRVMAASNLSDAIFMTVAALVSALILWLGFGILDLFLLLATLNLLVAVFYVRKLRP